MFEVIGTTPTGEVIVIAGLGPTADWYRNIRAPTAASCAVSRQRHTNRVRDEYPTDAWQTTIPSKVMSVAWAASFGPASAEFGDQRPVHDSIDSGVTQTVTKTRGNGPRHMTTRETVPRLIRLPDRLC
jgi:hypothetical protein